MDFFGKLGFDGVFVNTLSKNYNNDILDLIDYNEEKITNVISYFKSIGLSMDAIKELLLTDIDLFMMDLELIKKKFELYDIPKLVVILNADIRYIYKII